MNNEMHPDLKWLAENVSEWGSRLGLGSIIKVNNDLGSFADYVPTISVNPSGIYRQGKTIWRAYTFDQWIKARKDLGLIMTDAEAELPAEEWSTTITDTPEEAAMVEDMVNPARSVSVTVGGDKYSAYFKDVRHINTIDVYRVVSLFECERHGHPISHAAKKLLLSGSRTGGKDVESDVREAIDTLYRWLEMREEDQNAM